MREEQDELEDVYWRWLDDGPSQLRDSRTRQWWADQDGSALYTSIKDFTATDPSPHTIYVEFDGERWHATFLRAVEKRAEEKAFEHFARLIGSFLDNSRASLNYLAYELARLAIRDDPSLADSARPWIDQLHPKAVEFPIFDRRAKYKGSRVAGVIRMLPREYQDAFEAVQPFNGGDKCLWDLQCLAADYRHSVIHPVAVVPVKEQFRVVLDGHGMTADIDFLDDQPLRHGAKVMTFTLPEGIPERYKDVKPQVTLSIGLDHPLATGRDCTTILTGIARAVVRVAERFEPFFS